MDITKSTDMPIPTSGLPKPQNGLEVASSSGHKVLYVVFVAMLISTVIFWGLSFGKAKRDRVFNYLTGLVTLFAAISYYSMAVGFGNELIPARGHHHAMREVMTGRYYDWSLTTPLLLIDLALFAGLSPLDIVTLVIFDVLMVVTGLFASLVGGLGHKIGFYIMSCIFMLIVFAYLFINGSTTAKARGDKVKNAYWILALFTIVLWCCYPIVWMFSEGLNVITSDQEVIAYAILDVLAKPGFGALLLVFHRQIGDHDVGMPSWFVDAQSSAENYSILPQHE